MSLVGIYPLRASINAPNEDELFLAFLAGVKKEKKEYSNELYFENIIPRYSANDFRSHLRMSRHTVSVLENLLATRGAWRGVWSMDVDIVADISVIIIASCVLHNVCIVEDDIEDFLDAGDDKDNNDNDVDFFHH